MLRNIFLLWLFVMTSSVVAQSINGFDAQGRRHGKWQKTHPDSEKIRYKGQFNHGRETGLFEYFDDKNKFPYLTRQFNDTNRIALVTYYLPENGAVVSRGKMQDSLKVGVWVYFHKNTRDTLMVETYKNGKLEGEKRIYFPNGKITEVSYYQQGLRQGVTLVYDETGNLLSEIEYQNDTLNGLAKYYEFGKLIVKGFYKNGKRTGVWEFYKDGALTETKQF